MSDVGLSIIVPCYNESENLRRGVIEEMQRYLVTLQVPHEVLISDDGSTDQSREIVLRQIEDKPVFRLLQNAHAGKPAAVWQGIQAARGDIILFTDMDQSTPLNQLQLLLPFFEQGYDVVIGSRGLGRKNFPLHRRLGSAIFRAFRRLLVLPAISDTQCGFKAMKRDAALAVFPKLEAIGSRDQVTGWKVTAFDVEMLFLAQRAGYRIAEVIVDWSDRDVALGKGKSYFVESREMATQVLRVKVNDWRGNYD